jgi:TonB family protein
MNHQREFRVTMIDSATLLDRLAKELRFLFYQLKLSWPALKRDPVGFSQRAILELGSWLRRAIQPKSLAAMTTSVLVVLSAVLLLVLLGNGAKKNDPAGANSGERAEIVEFLPSPDAAKEDHGVGADGSGGRVGFARGKGEGSAPEPKRSGGGGGGGLREPLPAQVGKPPQPSEIPALIPKLPPAHAPTLPAAGIDIDPALWKNLPAAVYGDPRSKSTAPSNGPGDGGGMGTGTGQGVGEGYRSGVGPGTNGGIGDGPKSPGSGGVGGTQGNNPDDPDRIHPQSQVTERARVLMKPEPQYTEEARRNGVTGSVVLRVVFSRDGAVTNVRALQTLPFGLTERAIMAARLIRFRPATKNGLPVNVSMQLEYNFNLY